MRILFCNHEYPPLGGGGGVFNAFLAEELAKRHEVTVLTSGARGLVREERQNRVRILRVPVLIPRRRASAGVPWLAAYVLAARFAGARYEAAFAFDVINTQFVLPAGPVGDALARNSGIPNVLTLHGGDLFDPSKWTSPHRHAVLRFWIRRLLRRATAVVAQSTDTIKNVRQFYDAALPVERIPLGLRQPPAGVADRAAFGFEQSDTLLVTLGRLVPRKAVDRLIAIFTRMERLTMRLLILGTGPEEPALRRQASMGRAAERIHFFGHVSDVDKFHILRMCDVFVSTSQHEGFGLMFLEAMICGLPVVCYDCGGQTDFLETGRTGFVLKLNDENAFLSACEALMRDRNLRLVFGARGRRDAVGLMIEASARAYEALFERARSRRSQRPLLALGPWGHVREDLYRVGEQYEALRHHQRRGVESTGQAHRTPTSSRTADATCSALPSLKVDRKLVCGAGWRKAAASYGAATRGACFRYGPGFLAPRDTCKGPTTSVPGHGTNPQRGVS